MTNFANLLFCLLSILLSAVCWGAYTPLMNWGQTAMQGDRLRPFICVGIGYFAVSVLVPIVMLWMGMGDRVKWHPTGVAWSVAAGVAAALGALGILLALSFDGNPLYVMPLVFAGAPVVNTVIVITVNRQWGEVNPFFYAGLLLVGLGAVTVLVAKPSAPREHPQQTAEVEGSSVEGGVLTAEGEELTQSHRGAEKT